MAGSRTSHGDYEIHPNLGECCNMQIEHWYTRNNVQTQVRQ